MVNTYFSVTQVNYKRLVLQHNGTFVVPIRLILKYIDQVQADQAVRLAYVVYYLSIWKPLPFVETFSSLTCLSQNEKERD